MALRPIYAILVGLSFYIWPITVFFRTGSWLKSVAAIGVEVLLSALLVAALSFWMRR
jgi:hypothetical protein